MVPRPQPRSLVVLHTTRVRSYNKYACRPSSNLINSGVEGGKKLRKRERVEPRALLSGLRPHEGRPSGAPASLRLPGCPAAVTFRRITHMGCRTLSHRHMASKPLSDSLPQPLTEELPPLKDAELSPQVPLKCKKSSPRGKDAVFILQVDER